MLYDCRVSTIFVFFKGVIASVSGERPAAVLWYLCALRCKRNLLMRTAQEATENKRACNIIIVIIIMYRSKCVLILYTSAAQNRTDKFDERQLQRPEQHTRVPLTGRV